MEQLLVEVSETKSGLSYAVGADNIEYWKRKIKSYFENNADLCSTTRNLKLGQQLSIRKGKASRRDFVITLYNKGTILVQTKEIDIWGNHWKEITKAEECFKECPTPIQDEQEKKAVESNLENEIVKLVDIISSLNNRLSSMESKMNSLVEENNILKEENEKKNLSCWDWIEKRYELLKGVPNLCEENDKLKKKNASYKEKISNLNKRVNEVEKLLKACKEEKNNPCNEKVIAPLIAIPETVESYASVTSDHIIPVKDHAKNEMVNPIKKEKNILIFGDSILKYIDTTKLSGGIVSSNECIRGARIENIENHVKTFAGNKNNKEITDIVIHAGSNNLLKESDHSIMNKLCSLIKTTQKTFPTSIIHFSSILPKIHDSSIDLCKKINSTVKKFCTNNNISFIDNTSLFVNRDGIKYERLSRFDRIHLNKSGIIAMGKHLKFHLHNSTKEQSNFCTTSSPPPYSPSRSNFIIKSIPLSPFY